MERLFVFNNKLNLNEQVINVFKTLLKKKNTKMNSVHWLVGSLFNDFFCNAVIYGPPKTITKGFHRSTMKSER